MKKNTEEQNQQRLDLILDTAMDLFLQRDIDDVSVMDICQACNITKPTFYKYIDSKERILIHFFNGAVDEMEDLWENLEEPQDHLGRILVMVTNTMKRAEGSKTQLFERYLALCLREHRITERYTSKFVPLIQDEIRQAQKDGQILNLGDPVLVYESLRNLGLGISMRWITSDNAFKLVESYIRIACSFLNVNPEYHSELLARSFGL